MSRADNQWRNATRRSPRTGHHQALQLELPKIQLGACRMDLCTPEMQDGHGPRGWLARGTARNSTCPVHGHPTLDHVPESLIFQRCGAEDYGHWLLQQGGVGRPAVPPARAPSLAQGVVGMLVPSGRKPEMSWWKSCYYFKRKAQNFTGWVIPSANRAVFLTDQNKTQTL